MEGCVPRGDFDHHPVSRFDNDGLPGVSRELLVSTSVGFLFFRVNVSPSGNVIGDPGRDKPASEDDSDPDSGYAASLPSPSLLVRLSSP